MYSDKLQHYSTGRGEQLKWEKQKGETLPSLHPACAPLLPFQGGLGVGEPPWRMDRTIGWEGRCPHVSVRVWERAGAALGMEKEEYQEGFGE